VYLEDVGEVGPGGLHGDDPRYELIATLRDQLEAEREADREMRRLLAAALERIPAIETPQEAPEAPESAGETAGTAEPWSATEGTQEQTSPRPWWRRMFGS
jgi:hypothetical protein